MKTKTILIIISLLVVLTYSCEFPGYNSECFEGKGPVTEVLITENNFSGIELMSSFNIVIKQGSAQEIKAVGNRNIIDALDIYETEGTLVCGFKNGCYCNYNLTLFITVPSIDYLKSFGSGNINMEDFCNQGDLKVEVSGSGNITINSSVGTQNLDAIINGSGDLVANKGFDGLNKIDIKIYGSGNFRAYPLATNDCIVSVFGSGDCYCTTSKKLSARITGSGDVYYKGNPDVDSISFGTGKVKNSN